MTLDRSPFPLDPGPAPAGGITGSSGTGRFLQFIFLVSAVSMVVFHARTEAFTTFSIIFSSIVLEAFPFMLLGTLLGGMVEVFLSRDRLVRLLPGNRWLAIATAAFLGIIFPVCECAVVPVVRKFIQKGMPLGSAVAFLLGGPIVNPLVFTSTLVAYSFSWETAVIRVVMGVGIAVAGGIFIDSTVPRNLALVPDSGGLSQDCCHNGCTHNHHTSQSFPEKIKAALAHGAADFYDIGRFLIMGAFIAAALQTLVARQELLFMAEGPVIAIATMMLMAVILNLCSEADAFIAASFQPMGIPLSAQMAFMVLGPMLDIKLILMYLGAFTRKMILHLVCFVCLAVFLASLAMEVCQWFVA